MTCSRAENVARHDREDGCGCGRFRQKRTARNSIGGVAPESAEDATAAGVVLHLYDRVSSWDRLQVIPGPPGQRRLLSR